MIPLKDDNPTRTVPYVNYGIIALNVLIFGYMLTLVPQENERFVQHYSVVPSVFFSRAGLERPAYYLNIISSMFLHGGLFHLGGNMLFLWVFGDNIEDYLGHARYILFYLLCGTASVVAQGVMSSGSDLPMLGASGAISGVLGAYILLYPRAGVWTFFFFIFFFQVIKVPAVFILGLWIVLQFINGFFSISSGVGGVAWFAHIGGFFSGVVLILLLKRRNIYSRLA